MTGKKKMKEGGEKWRLKKRNKENMGGNKDRKKERRIEWLNINDWHNLLKEGKVKEKESKQ